MWMQRERRINRVQRRLSTEAAALELASELGHNRSNDGWGAQHDPMGSAKVFVYEPPPQFNSGLLACGTGFDQLFDDGITNAGLGPKLREVAGWGVTLFETSMWGVEPIMHQRMLRSRHRTMDPDKASIFYVPYYPRFAVDCLRRFPGFGRVENQPSGDPPPKPDRIMAPYINNLTDSDDTSVSAELEGDLWRWLEASPYFARHGGHDHLVALSHAEVFHKLEASRYKCRGCSGFLNDVRAQNIMRASFEVDCKHSRPCATPSIAAPYPSSAHCHQGKPCAVGVGVKWKAVGAERRPDWLIFVGSTDRNPYRRAFCRHLFKTRAPRRIAACDKSATSDPGAVFEKYRRTTFCLQPPGDTATRKGFFDAVLAGCIPVIASRNVRYPFDDVLDYNSFTVRATNPERVVEELLRLNASRIVSMRRSLADVARSLQYSAGGDDEDAADYILREALQRSAPARQARFASRGLLGLEAKVDAPPESSMTEQGESPDELKGRAVVPAQAAPVSPVDVVLAEAGLGQSVNGMIASLAGTTHDPAKAPMMEPIEKGREDHQSTQRFFEVMGRGSFRTATES